MNTSQPERGLVWIVEDSPLEAEMTRRALAATHDASVFGDGATMLEALLSASVLPEVVVIDIVLPGISGIELCRAIREHHTTMALPVLLLTVQPRSEVVFNAFDLGVNDYLCKPVDPRELVARVAGLSRTARIYREHVQRSHEMATSAALGLAVTAGNSLEDVASRSLRALAEHVPNAGIAIAAAGTDGSLEVVASEGDARAVALATGALDPSPPHAHAFALTVQGALVGKLGLLTKNGARGAGLTPSITNLLALGLVRAVLLERERKARSAAETANRAKDEFLAVVSHELRTPLNAIVGWATLLRQGSLPADRVKSAVEKIERNALAQSQLIDDLLDISRIITGKMALTPVEVDVPAAARASLASVELAANKKGVSLEVACDEATRVTGDPARVQQIIWNLLSNAVRFTPAGGRVTLTVAEQTDGVHITVADTGAGIDPAFLPQIFDRFTQGSTARARSHGGLGLGLAIVRHLVELHGGLVEARSEGLGKGAVFDVRLPFAHGGPTPDEATQTPLPYRSTHGLEGKHVLVVDDQPDARELMKEVLELLGVVVTTASNAVEALARIGERSFAAMISDIGMPGADGLELMRSIRKHEHGDRMRAIALSAYAAENDKRDALNAGFDAHVKKPVDTSELIDTLRALVCGSNATYAGLRKESA